MRDNKGAGRRGRGGTFHQEVPGKNLKGLIVEIKVRLALQMTLRRAAWMKAPDEQRHGGATCK